MSRRASEKSGRVEKALEPDGATTSSPAARKPYLRPALQSYGKLVDVTHFGGSIVLDSGVGNLGQT